MTDDREGSMRHVSEVLAEILKQIDKQQTDKDKHTESSWRDNVRGH